MSKEKRFIVAATDAKDDVIALGLERLINDPKAETTVIPTANLLGMLIPFLEEAKNA